MSGFTINRVEKKYMISLETALKLQEQLSKVMKIDKYCVGGKSYEVKSLYFDTVNDMDYYEKCSGIENRKKIRLRKYEKSDVIKLELKKKQGVFTQKDSMVISKQDALEIIMGKYSHLLQYDLQMAKEFYAIMNEKVYIPRTIVKYNRLAYTVPINNTRITFDYNLMAQEANFQLFREDVQYYPIQSQNKIILEIKFDHFLLGYIKTILKNFDLMECAMSKYTHGRYLGLGENKI